MFYRRYGTSSALNVAIVDRNFDKIKQLLAEGADPNAPDEMGWRPLHVGIGQADPGVAAALTQLLLKYGARVNEWDAEHNETPILTASDPPKPNTARILLAAGAEPNVVRSDGQSPLRLAVQANDLELANLLLEHGADRTINEYGGIYGLTALGLAAMDFNIPMIELLLQAGADPETIEEFGETARDKLPPRENYPPQEWDRVMDLLGRRRT